MLKLTATNKADVIEEVLRLLRDTNDEHVMVHTGKHFTTFVPADDLDEDMEPTGTVGLDVSVEDEDGDEVDGGGHIVGIMDAYDRYIRTGDRREFDESLDFALSLIPSHDV